MEAAGVELSNLLSLRKLLVLQEATSAKKGSLPGRRYKNGTNGCDLTCPALAQSSNHEVTPDWMVAGEQHTAVRPFSDSFSWYERVEYPQSCKGRRSLVLI